MISLPRSSLSLSTCLCLVVYSLCMAQKAPSEITELNKLSVFEEQYLLFGMNRNFPVKDSLNTLGPSQAHPFIGFGHTLHQEWFLNVQAGFRFLDKKSSFQITGQNQDPRIAIWSVSQESLGIIRISHPLYLLTGPSLLYLLPTRKGMLPIQRDPDFPLEVGAGWSAWFVWTKPSYFSAVKFERWRGTYSHRLHAFQISCLLGFSI
ncbi:MAG: hypothetical protein AB8C84_02690 [Oligoflexales bacterium]